MPGGGGGEIAKISQRKSKNNAKEVVKKEFSKGSLHTAEKRFLPCEHLPLC